MIRQFRSESTPKLPDFPALKTLWRALDAEEAAMPPGRRLGVALARMELLAGIPEPERPAFIDQLNEEVSV